MDLGGVLTGGGTAGLIVAVAYAVKMFLDFRAKRPTAGTHATTAVTNAETANAILGKTLERLEAENGRMARKIRHLEEEAEVKDRKIDELEQRLNDIAAELSALKTHG